MKMKTLIARPETHEDASSFEQIIAKAEQEITRLEAQQRQIALKLQADRAELDTLTLQATAHTQEKDIAQSTIDQRRKALREAEVHAELASGTLASKKPDLKGLEKLLKQAQQEQMVILDRIGKAEQGEQRRSLMLQEACERHQRDLAQLAERKEAMEATRQRVFVEQGETILQDHLHELASLQDALTTAEQEVEQARANIDDMGRKALLSLSEWPALVDQLSTVLPFHNPTVDVLEATIGLMDVLLSSNHNIERIDSDLLQEAGINYRQVEHLLSWPTDVLYPVLYRPDLEPIELRQNKTDLSKVLALYIARKREVRG
jgi:chromosome segregation ATPase